MKKENRRDIVIGIIILLLIAVVIVVARRPQKSGVVPPTSSPIDYEKQIEDSFNITIPDDYQKADLKDVSGGEGAGIATRKFENGKFIHTVLADLVEAQPGYFYQAWLVRGNEMMPTGILRLAKGGFLFEMEANKDYSDYKGVVVSLERINDGKMEKKILEGSF